jgi:hypothetical protein
MRPGHLLLVYGQDDPNEDVRERLALTASRSSHGRVLWVSAAPLADGLAALAEFLSAGAVTSAALVPADLPDERLWLAYEWWDAFVVDRNLISLLGEASGMWVQDPRFDTRELGVKILRPARSAHADDPGPRTTRQVETAREYAEAITADQPVLVNTTLAGVLEAPGAWFGDMADPRVGGAFALLVLSGARSESTDITLRSPAALRLKVGDSDASLPHHVRAGRLTVRGYGYSRGNASRMAEAHPDSFPESDGGMLLEALGERTSFGILLQIEVNIDPEIEIEEGSIFEQTSVNNVQTLATARSQRMTVDPGRFTALALPAWCLNSSLKAPSGQQVRPTPLVLINRGESQDEVWAERNSVLTGGAP